MMNEAHRYGLVAPETFVSIGGTLKVTKASVRKFIPCCSIVELAAAHFSICAWERREASCSMIGSAGRRDEKFHLRGQTLVTTIDNFLSVQVTGDS